MRAYAGRQFVPFLWWSLVWPGREANSRLPCERRTEPTRHGLSFFFFFFVECWVSIICLGQAQNLWRIFSTLHSGFTLHTQVSNTLSVECWVSVISLEPGLDCMVLFFITSTHTRIIGPLLVARSIHISDGIWLFQIYSHTLTMMFMALNMWYNTNHLLVNSNN